MSSHTAAKTNPPCLFCKSTGPTSREHIYPKWIFKIVDLPETHFKPSVHPVEISTDNDIANKPGNDIYIGKKIPYKGNVLRGICAKCNSEWMGQLEDNARKIFQQLVDDQTTLETLNKDDAEILSRWAILKIMLIGQSLQEPVPFDDEDGDILMNGGIPQGYMVEAMKLQTNEVNYAMGVVYPKIARTISPAQMAEELADYIPGAIQFGQFTFRVTCLRTNTKMYRIQQLFLPTVLYPYHEFIPNVNPDESTPKIEDIQDKLMLPTFLSSLCISDKLPKKYLDEGN